MSGKYHLVLVMAKSADLRRYFSGLSFYEWLVTLGQEVDHIWARKWTVSTWIFACIRYATILDSITQIWPTSSYKVSSLFYVSVET